MLLQRNIQAKQQLAGAGIGGIAVHFSELDFQVRDRHPVFFAHLGQGIDPITLFLDVPEFLMAHDHGIDHRAILIGKLVLAQFTQTDIGLQHDLAGGGLEIATQDFHQCGLATAIGPDQAIAITVTKFGGDVFKQGFSPELHGDIGGGDQETNLSMWGRACAGEKKAGIVQVCPVDCEAAETRIKRACL